MATMTEPGQKEKKIQIGAKGKRAKLEGTHRQYLHKRGKAKKAILTDSEPVKTGGAANLRQGY